MKKRSKFISILMCIAMLVTLLVSNYKVGQAAKKKMSINKTKVTMDYDETYIISIKNPIQKVKWTSSNKKIATIKAFNSKNSKCKIFAHKKGKATITAKVGNKKFKCKVTIVNRETDIDSVSTAIPTVESTATPVVTVTPTVEPTATPVVTATPTYTTGDYVSDDYIQYISDRSVEYNSEYKEFRVFFSFKLKDKNTRVASSGNIHIIINNNKNQLVYEKDINFDKDDFGYWTSTKWGGEDQYLCCIYIPVSDIKNGATSSGVLEMKVTMEHYSFESSKHSVYNLPEGYEPTVNPEPEPTANPEPEPTVEPQEKYNQNFDQIVAYVIKEGELSTYGSYCTYGYVSVSMSGDKIEIFQNWGREGHNVLLTRGSKIATAMATLNNGTQVTAEFDISTFKGDGTDRLQWSNNPSTDLQYTYDVAIANVIKKVANYNFYIGKYSFQDIGFASYLF